ncbi:MAG: hypothetical protein FJ098_07860, partial [Deltaproteobacteria bacterium]|nr:hypothetical protein [Deltaproteobacteria bacterium]
GDDGCGGSCGDCPLGTTCSPGQECLDPCHGVGFEGCCDGVVLHYCDGDHEIVADCAAQGLVCGWMENVGWYDCATKADEDPTGEHPLWCEGACKPSCAERECGDDACGGTCGTCPEGEFCTEAGLCEAPCPGLPAAGCCDGDLLRFCDLLAGAADDADCAGEGLRCGWDSSLSLYNCVAQPAADPSGLRPRACPGTCTPACGGRACGDDGCGGTCGACVPGFSCLEGICTLAPPPEDVLEPAGDTGDAGGAGRTAGGCGPGPGTPAPGLLLAALALLSGLPRRKAEPRGGPLEH